MAKLNKKEQAILDSLVKIGRITHAYIITSLAIDLTQSLLKAICNEIQEKRILFIENYSQGFQFLFAKNFMGKGDAFIGCISGGVECYMHKPFYNDFKYHKSFYVKSVNSNGYLSEEIEAQLNFNYIRELNTFKTNWSLLQQTRHGGFNIIHPNSMNFEEIDHDVYELSDGTELNINELEPRDVLFNVSQSQYSDDPFIGIVFTPRQYWNAEHCAFDQELSGTNIDNILNDLDMSEEAESFYTYYGDKTVEQIKQTLLDAGFSNEESFNQFLSDCEQHQEELQEQSYSIKDLESIMNEYVKKELYEKAAEIKKQIDKKKNNS